MAESWQLDQRLAQDSHLLGRMDGCRLLLMNNSIFPWFVLVPDTQEIEFYRLDKDLQQLLVEQINRVSRFVDEDFDIDKLNVATIGNMVSQMHIHIVGRRKDDPCWPGVVWGCDSFRSYSEPEVDAIKNKALAAGLITG